MSDGPIVVLPRQRIERLEQRVAVLEALVQRIAHTHEQLPAVIGKALEEAMPLP